MASWAISSRPMGITPFSSDAGIGRGHALELQRRHRLDAFHRLRGGDDAAQVDRLAEREVVGMEHREAPVGQHAAAQLGLHRAQHLAAEVVGLHADVQRDVERHVARRVDLEVVAGHAKALEVTAQPRLEARVDRGAAEAVGGDEHRVPASGPAKRRRGALHFGAPLGGRRIVGGGDGALLGAEGLGRVAPRRVDVFGIDAARRGHRVGDCVEHARDVADDVGDGVRPDVAGGAVAHAVGRLERGAGIGTPAVHVVAETQQRDAVVLRLHNEVGGIAVTREQVAARGPDAGNGLDLAPQLGDQRQGVMRIANEQRARRPPAFVLRERNAPARARGRSPGSTARSPARDGSAPESARLRARRHDCAPAAAAARRRRGSGTVAERLVAHGLAVIDEHDVAERHADLQSRPFLDRHAQRKRQRVRGVPEDLGDRQRRVRGRSRRTD